MLQIIISPNSEKGKIVQAILDYWRTLSEDTVSFEASVNSTY